MLMVVVLVWASLGWASASSRVNPWEPLRISLSKGKEGFPYAIDLDVEGLSEPSAVTIPHMNVAWPEGHEPSLICRMEIPWHGRLEWWFGQQWCELDHSA